MKSGRRRFLRLAAGTAAFALAPPAAWAEAYPSRPVRWVVPFAPGGGTDLVARLVGQWLTDHLRQPFIVENRPGGGADIGTGAVARAAPDGHTLLFAASVNAINATLRPKAGFEFERDIAPVAGLVRVPNLMVVHPSVPAVSIAEFIDYARASRGKVNFGSAGTGTSQHLAGELFKIMAGVDMQHVPYRGTAPALTDLVAGRLQLLFLGPGSAMEFVRSGKLRPLGVTSAARSPAWPRLPAVGEFLPGFEATLFYGVGAPKGTPAAIIRVLNEEIDAALADASIQARLGALDGMVLGGSPADFGRLVADETAKWRRVIEVAHIRAE